MLHKNVHNINHILILQLYDYREFAKFTLLDVESCDTIQADCLLIAQGSGVCVVV